MKQVVSHGVDAEEPYEILGIEHIALGFAHLVFAHEQPRVAENLLGQGLIKCHENYRPVNCVETENVLAYEVYIGRPVFLIHIGVVALDVVAQECDVVGKGVYPNIDNMTGVKLHGHAPCKCASRDAQVCETGSYEVVEHLVLSGGGLNEVGVLLDVFFKSFGVV